MDPASSSPRSEASRARAPRHTRPGQPRRRPPGRDALPGHALRSYVPPSPDAVRTLSGTAGSSRPPRRCRSRCSRGTHPSSCSPSSSRRSASWRGGHRTHWSSPSSTSPASGRGIASGRMPGRERRLRRRRGGAASLRAPDARAAPPLVAPAARRPRGRAPVAPARRGPHGGLRRGRAHPGHGRGFRHRPVGVLYGNLVLAALIPATPRARGSATGATPGGCCRWPGASGGAGRCAARRSCCRSGRSTSPSAGWSSSRRCSPVRAVGRPDRRLPAHDTAAGGRRGDRVPRRARAEHRVLVPLPVVALVVTTVMSTVAFAPAHGSLDPWILIELGTLAVFGCYLAWRTGGLEAVSSSTWSTTCSSRFRGAARRTRGVLRRRDVDRLAGLGRPASRHRG